MIIVKIQGRLGNQMFCYAFAKNIKNKYNNVKIDCELLKTIGDKYELDLFPNIYNENFIEKASLTEIYKLGDFRNRFLSKVRRKIWGLKSTYIKERTNGFDKTVLCETRAYLEGYWQTEKYFKDIENEIRYIFEFPPINEKHNILYAEDIKGNTSVSIHIRRGDYLEENNQGIYGGICTSEYYEQAILYFQKKYETVKFFVFSDDVAWARNTYQDNDSFVIISGNEGQNCFRDMQLMSMCDHNIIANSSFSWWGAWLNSNPNKEIVSPRRWLNSVDTPDIWCDNWIKI